MGESLVPAQNHTILLPKSLSSRCSHILSLHLISSLHSLLFSLTSLLCTFPVSIQIIYFFQSVQSYPHLLHSTYNSFSEPSVPLSDPTQTSKLVHLCPYFQILYLLLCPCLTSIYVKEGTLTLSCIFFFTSKCAFMFLTVVYRILKSFLPWSTLSSTSFPNLPKVFKFIHSLHIPTVKIYIAAVQFIASKHHHLTPPYTDH